MCKPLVTADKLVLRAGTPHRQVGSTDPPVTRQDPKVMVMLSHFPYALFLIFIPFFTHLSMNEASI
jgi:hypothetical protein